MGPSSVGVLNLPSSTVMSTETSAGTFSLPVIMPVAVDILGASPTLASGTFNCPSLPTDALAETRIFLDMEMVWFTSLTNSSHVLV